MAQRPGSVSQDREQAPSDVGGPRPAEPYLSTAEAERAVEAALGGVEPDDLPMLVARLLATAGEFERRMRTAEREAVVDPLTGLGNRRQWRTALRAAEERCRRGADDVVVAVIDLDDFKAVNDELGHAVGDELLRRLAITLTAEVRGGDTVARIGGDEFAVLAFDTDDAPALTARLGIALEAAGIEASVGAANRRSAGSLEEAWVCADEAMYATKARRSHRRRTEQPPVP